MTFGLLYSRLLVAPWTGRYSPYRDRSRRPSPALMEQSYRPPVRSVRRPLLRSFVELEAHVLIATSRTSGRTSPPNTGIPMFVRRMCINPSVLCATTTWKTLYPPPRTCQRSHLTFLNAGWSACQHFSSSASCTCEPLVWSMPAIPERIEFLKRLVILKKGLL